VGGWWSVGRPVGWSAGEGAVRRKTRRAPRVRDDRTASAVLRERDNRNEDRFIVAEKPTSKCARARLYVSFAVYHIIVLMYTLYTYTPLYLPMSLFVFYRRL